MPELNLKGFTKPQDKVEQPSLLDAVGERASALAGAARGAIQGSVEESKKVYEGADRDISRSLATIIDAAVEGYEHPEATKFGEKIQQAFDEARINPDEYPLIHTVAQHPRASAAIAAGVGETADLFADPLAWAGGKVAVGAITATGRHVVSPLVKSHMAKRMTEVERRTSELRAQGIGTKAATERAMNDVGVTKEYLQEVGRLTGTKMHIPAKIDPTKFDKVSTNIVGKATTKIDDFFNNVPSGALSSAKDTVDDFIRPIISRIDSMSPKIAAKLERFENNFNLKLRADTAVVQSWLSSYNKLSSGVRREMDQALFSGDFEKARSLMSRGMVHEFDANVRELLSRRFIELKQTQAKTGDIDFVDNFFPRHIVDMKGFQKAIGKSVPAAADDIATAASAAKAAKGGELTPGEYSEIANRVMRKPDVQTALKKISTERKRKFTTVEDSLLPFYGNAGDSIKTYIRDANHAIERRKFFGRTNTVESVDDSIGKLMQAEAAAKTMTHHERAVVTQLLRSRFIGGETAPRKGIQRVRNLTYTTLLGNPFSAATQIGDIAVAGYLHGMGPTIRAMAQTIRGSNKQIDMEKLGLDIAAELQETAGKSRRLLDMSLTGSGFRLVDRLGKNIHIKAAQNKWKKKLHTNKGVAEFEQRFGASFTKEEMRKVKTALRGGKATQETKQVVFSELLKAQPIALSSMPKVYLDNPNMRIFYMLKSFSLKQFDLVRQNALSKIAKGQVAKGSADLARYGLLVAIGGNGGVDAAKQAILGKDFEMSDIIFANILKSFALNNRVYDTLKQGRPLRALLNLAAPPISALDDLLGFARGDLGKTIDRLPPFGKAMTLFLREAGVIPDAEAASVPFGTGPLPRELEESIHTTKIVNDPNDPTKLVRVPRETKKQERVRKVNSPDQLIETILKHEGGYQANPNDTGNFYKGKNLGTNRGITPATYKAFTGEEPTKEAMKNISKEQAAEIYKTQYITKPKIDQLPENIIGMVADTGVMSGPSRAIKILQTVVGAKADGLIGPNTLKKVEEYKGDIAEDFTKARKKFYADLAKGDKRKAKFLKGWNKRADSFTNGLNSPAIDQLDAAQPAQDFVEKSLGAQVLNFFIPQAEAGVVSASIKAFKNLNKVINADDISSIEREALSILTAREGASKLGGKLQTGRDLTQDIEGLAVVPMDHIRNPRELFKWLQGSPFKSDKGEPMVWFRFTSNKNVPGEGLGNSRSIQGPRELGLHVGTLRTIEAFNKVANARMERSRQFEMIRKELQAGNISQREANRAVGMAQGAPNSAFELARKELSEAIGEPVIQPIITNIKNPLRLGDMQGFFPEHVIPQLKTKFPHLQGKLRQIEDSLLRRVHTEEEVGKILQKMIKDEGHDSVIYTNLNEGIGDQSLIIFDEKNIKRLSDI